MIRYPDSVGNGPVQRVMVEEFTRQNGLNYVLVKEDQ